MSVAHPRLLFLNLLWWSFLHLHDTVGIFVAFSPKKVALQKEAEQMYAIGEWFIFNFNLIFVVVKSSQVDNKDLIAAFYVNIGS